MNIRLLITVCCFALIQFQGKAAYITIGGYGIYNNNEANTITQLIFNYQIVTASPQYILFFAVGNPFTPIGVNSVMVNGTSVAFTSSTSFAGPGIFVQLQNPSLASAGSQIVISANVRLPYVAGQYNLGDINTVSNGMNVDRTNYGSFGPPIQVAPMRTPVLASEITSSSFKVDWSSSPGTQGHYIDISTDPFFNTILPGYSSLDIGNVTSYEMLGLSSSTTYYFRKAAYYIFTDPYFNNKSPYTSISIQTSSATTSTALVTLSNLTATYDGSPRAATAVTTPAGLAVKISYDGSSTVPTTAGTYAVVATVNDANYQGTTSGNLVISKATANPVLSNLTAVYNGSPRAATATTTPTGLTVSITYNGSSTAPTNIGTYAVVATVSDANYQGSATGNLVISKATANPVLSNLSLIYNGSPQVFTATTTPSGLNVVKTYNGFSSIPTNAGTYAVVATVSDANYQGSATGNLVISKATITPVLGNLTTTYNGSAQQFTATTTPAGLNINKLYNGFSSIPTNAGTYAVSAIISDVNYQGTATGSMVISKATITPVLSNLTATYNGSPRAATATTTPTGLTVDITYNGSSTVPTNVGTYAVVATVSDANYQGSATGNLVISKATANPVLNNLTAVYNGSPRAVTATTTPAGLAVKITYDGSSTTPTNAGTYPVVATVNDAHYQGSAAGSLVISKATANPVLSNLAVAYNGSAHAATATTTPAGLNVTITYNGSDAVPVEVGSYAVAATIDDVNYQGSSTGTLTINPIATGVTGKVLTDVKLFPNPCKEFVCVDAGISSVTTIRIVDVAGVTVIQKDNYMQQERLDISMLAKGIYVVVVDAESGIGSYRLIVQ